MCVIAICTTVRPSEEQVQLMWTANAFGGGAAWRTKREGVPHVAFKKGLILEEMQEFAKELPLPYILHFRIPSVGKDCDALTHPFVVQDDSPLVMEGETSGGVLFHNGTWNGWRTELKFACLTKGFSLPTGEYSDSRAMAILAAHMGPGILELIDEKVVLFGPEDILTFHDVGWTTSEGITYSNMGWKRSTSFSSSATAGGSSRDTYFLGSGSGSASGGLGSSGGKPQGTGDSYYTTPPASMAGGSHDVKGGGPAEVNPFGDVAPTRKVLRRLRQQQGKAAIKRLHVSAGAIFPAEK